ncbi:unnamed protein product [Macrosiphum euphorbiae]|uniref:Uncharacterized protein n=1 Tax=Macrosiphum euphorbiae TaxID=13131 RepID=A0AAV0YDF2_9HEMI|nr:unnamed protein product [Macrosiphum euphorbiae]
MRVAGCGISKDNGVRVRCQDRHIYSTNSNHSDHINAVEDDLVNVGDLDNEVNLETETNTETDTKDIGDYLIFIICNLVKMLAYFCKFNGCCVFLQNLICIAY